MEYHSCLHLPAWSPGAKTLISLSLYCFTFKRRAILVPPTESEEELNELLYTYGTYYCAWQTSNAQ